MNGWAGVELRHLAVLAAVAEERSFRGAADRLGYVQSAVSQRIAQLELAVGARLVERSRGHKDVRLTEAGVTLVRHAERIAAQLTTARAELGEIADERPAAGIKVGACGGEAARLVPAALGRLARRSPLTRIHLRESRSERELFAAVASGELDVAVAELPLEAGPFESRRLLVDPLVALVAADSPLLAAPSQPSLDELAAQPFVVDPSWRMFELIEAELAASGIELDARFTTTGAATTRALVAAGLGVAIVPRIDVDPDDPETVAIGLGEALPSRTVACFWSPDCRAEPLASFLEAIEQVSRRYRASDAPTADEPCMNTR